MLFSIFNVITGKFKIMCVSYLYLALCFSWVALFPGVSVAQSCPAVCDPMDCSLPGSSIHGIFQARVVEWVAMPFSRGASHPSDRWNLGLLHHRQTLYHLSYRGRPIVLQNATDFLLSVFQIAFYFAFIYPFYPLEIYEAT